MSDEPKTSAERFNELSRLNKWGLSYCPPGETMSVDAPKCPSCGVTYQNHLGLIGTCKKLQEIFALVEDYLNGQPHSSSRTGAAKEMCEKILELKDKEDEQ